MHFFLLYPEITHTAFVYVFDYSLINVGKLLPFPTKTASSSLNFKCIFLQFHFFFQIVLLKWYVRNGDYNMEKYLIIFCRKSTPNWILIFIQYFFRLTYPTFFHFLLKGTQEFHSYALSIQFVLEKSVLSSTCYVVDPVNSWTRGDMSHTLARLL